jgi:hypothetical protein
MRLKQTFDLELSDKKVKRMIESCTPGDFGFILCVMADHLNTMEFDDARRFRWTLVQKCISENAKTMIEQLVGITNQQVIESS